MHSATRAGDFDDIGSFNFVASAHIQCKWKRLNSYCMRLLTALSVGHVGETQTSPDVFGYTDGFARGANKSDFGIKVTDKARRHKDLAE